MNHRYLHLLCAALALVLLGSCSVEVLDSKLPPPQYMVDYKVTVPEHMREDMPETLNELDPTVVELGRYLFYDPILSSTGEVSCGTCHQQRRGFADGEEFSSAGVSGKPLKRNTPGLTNVAWYQNGLFWDGRAANLEELNLIPLQHVDEMGRDLDELLQDLEDHPSLKARFDRAFPGEPVTLENLTTALSQFQRSIVSGNSKYDRYLRGEARLSPGEQEGLEIFKQGCAPCHSGVMFTDFKFHNVGLESEFSDEDTHGRAAVVNNSEFTGAYKTPTLRNIALTAPYMHDGRFATLDDVIEHYSSGVAHSEYLDPILKDIRALLPPGGNQYTPSKKDKLKFFLQALTDREFVEKPSLSNPY